MPTDDLALNIFIILLSTFGIFALNHIFHGKYHQWVFGLLPSAAVVLCMSFPFTLFPGQIYDLRLVLLLTVILYGGYRAGISVTATAFIYRYLLGGFGFIQMVVTFTPFLALAFMAFPRFASYSKSRKMIVAVGLNMATVLLNVVFVEYRYPVDQEHLRVLLEWAAIESATTALTVFLIEIVRDNIVMSKQLQEVEKTQLVSSLAASIAHEIRNPLTTSRGFLQLLMERNPTKQQADYIDITLSELNRAGHIIDEYLSVSKPQVGTLETTDIAASIRHAIDTIGPYATLHDVKILYDLHSNLYAMIDSEKFHQAVLNIMKNGIESMSSGGILTLKVFRQRTVIVIQIADTGVGMTTEQLNRLGNPFYSTKTKGTGLGLMVSYRYVQMMKGTIQAESKVEKGSTFSIRLPLTNGQRSEVVQEPLKSSSPFDAQIMQ